jgi:hypothetical protein
MGYIPPRSQRSDESDAEYIAYLERRLALFGGVFGDLDGALVAMLGALAVLALIVVNIR